MDPIFKRVVLKLSGEALAGEKGTGIDDITIKRIAEDIKEVQKLGVEVSVVVGGGNFWRGIEAKEIATRHVVGQW